MSFLPHSELRIPNPEDDIPMAMPVTIVHGAGVLAPEPVIERQQPVMKEVTFAPSYRRRIVETVVFFVCTILFLRTIAVEPYGVPTGSMSPTMIGNHKAFDCPRCGFHIMVGDPSNRHGYPVSHCLNCGKTDLAITAASEVAGDRLLVDKNTLRIRKPRRWEVAVFICPSDKSKPYVKRIVALPGELVHLKDGDIFVDGQLARKTLTQARECQLPVFDSTFSPPDGWSRRWLADGVTPVLGAVEAPKPPEWARFFGNDIHLNAEQAVAPRFMSYWHILYDSHTPEVIRDGFEYNGHSAASQCYSVHDFLVEFDVEVLAGNGYVLCKMSDGADDVTGQIAAGAEFGESKLMVPPEGLVKTANRTPLRAGKSYKVTMAFVDRRATLAVNGKEYFSYDLPVAAQRSDVISPFKIGAQGVSIAIRNVKLHRDIYYRPTGKHASATPLQLAPDEYFLLGDNSANSDDGRSWEIPGVPERNFLGRPFLLHQPSRPGSWTLGGRRIDVLSIDWNRIRWLR
jgi:signal peptidase I